MISYKRLLCVSLVVLASSAFAAPTHYHVRVLQGIDPSEADIPMFIRNDGVVVGSVGSDFTHRYAARWESDGSLSYFGTGGTYDNAALRGLNDHDVAVGSQLTNSGDYGFVKDFTSSVQTTIPITYPTAINNLGEIVGDNPNFSGGEYVRYRNASGTTVNLDGPSWATSVQAFGINDSGQIVGTSYSSTRSQGWKRTRTGAYEALASPDGDPLTKYSAAAQNQLGDICGSYRVGNDGHAILWKADGSVVDLGTPFGDGSFFSAAGTSINTLGAIVGGVTYSTGPITSESNGFIWTQSDGMQLLTPLMDDPDWQFDGIRGINDAGQIIGWGRHSLSGKQYAFVLDPQAVPEPSSIVVLTGIALAGWSRRRKNR